VGDSDVLRDLEKAAERRQQLADAHREKAKHYSQEAKEFRRVRDEIERKLGKDRDDE
jgi:hypothetical protein